MAAQGLQDSAIAVLVDTCWQLRGLMGGAVEDGGYGSSIGDTTQRRVLTSFLGYPGLGEEDLATARGIIEATGARSSCEELIASSTTKALTALEGIDMNTEGYSALVKLAELATDRDR